MNSTVHLICWTTDWIFVRFERNFQDLSARHQPSHWNILYFRFLFAIGFNHVMKILMKYRLNFHIVIWTVGSFLFLEMIVLSLKNWFLLKVLWLLVCLYFLKINYFKLWNKHLTYMYLSFHGFNSIVKKYERLIVKKKLKKTNVSIFFKGLPPCFISVCIFHIISRGCRAYFMIDSQVSLIEDIGIKIWGKFRICLHFNYLILWN